MAAAAPASPLTDALRKLGPHDHLCSVYDTREEQFAVTIPFIAIGLERHEKCIYIAESDGLDSTRKAMRASGIDVVQAEKSGALTLTTKEQTYLERGSFDPDWMFAFWREAAEKAQAGGFSALRATNETDWVLRGGPGMERWTEYESRLTETMAETNCLALCQYNWRRFPPGLILDLIRTHPIVVYRDVVCRNLYYAPPREFLDPAQPMREAERLLRNIREHEQQIQHLNQALGAVNEELEAFTYSVSHDLRAPLHHINGFSQLLVEELGIGIDPTSTHYLTRIREGAARMGQLLDGLLHLSRVGRQQVRKRETDLNVVVKEILSELEPQTAGREIQWRIGKLPAVSCDPVLMRLVFLNLLSNAVKFTRPRTPAVIEVDTVSSNGRQIICCRDNGVGFSMLSAGKLFGVFQRFHHQEDFEGLGLGLATAQRIVRNHGGVIWAESEPGKGAAFYVALPDREETPPSLDRNVSRGES